MACLDTNFLICMWNGDPGVRELIERIKRGGDEVKTTAMNIAELYHGARLARHRRYMKWVSKLERRFQVLSFDARAALHYGMISSHLSENKMKVDEDDVIIASIAAANGEKVVTRDRDFSRFPGVEVIRW